VSEASRKNSELLYAVCIQPFKIIFRIIVNFCTLVLLNSPTDCRNHV